MGTLSPTGRYILKAPISQHISSAVPTQIQIKRDGYLINRLEPAILKGSGVFYKVTQQLVTRFSPNPLDIKKHIEGMIDVGYPCRSEWRIK